MSITASLSDVMAEVGVNLTTRRQILLDRLLEGKTLQKAAEEPGPDGTPLYSCRQSAANQVSNMREGMRAALDKAGLTTEVLAAKLLAQLEADDLVFASFQGQFTDVTSKPDNMARAKALELAHRLRGDLADDSKRVNVGTVNIAWAGAAPAWAPTSSVVTGDTIDPPVPISSTIEGTGTDRGPVSPTNSGNFAVEAKAKVKRKCGPRLPVAGKRYGKR